MLGQACKCALIMLPFKQSVTLITHLKSPRKVEKLELAFLSDRKSFPKKLERFPLYSIASVREISFGFFCFWSKSCIIVSNYFREKIL